MKSRPLPLLIVIAAIMTGCIPVPAPHEQWISPRFHGVVTDAATGQPLPKVKITLHHYVRVAKDDQPVAVYTDDRGSFAVLASCRAFWTLVWLGPAEGPQGGTVTFEADGYTTSEEQRVMFGSAYARPDFEVNVRLERKPHPALEPTGPPVAPRK